MFAAKKAILVQFLYIDLLRNLSEIQKVQILHFILFPIQLLIPILCKQLFCRSKIDIVLISDVGYFLCEELQIGSLGKSGQLGYVIDPGIDNFFYARVLQKTEKLFRRFPGESNGIELNLIFPLAPPA